MNMWRSLLSIPLALGLFLATADSAAAQGRHRGGWYEQNRGDDRYDDRYRRDGSFGNDQAYSQYQRKVDKAYEKADRKAAKERQKYLRKQSRYSRMRDYRDPYYRDRD